MSKLIQLKEIIEERFKESEDPEMLKFLKEQQEILLDIELEQTQFYERHEKLKHDHVALIKSSPVLNEDKIEQEDVRPSSSDIFKSWKEGIEK